MRPTPVRQEDIAVGKDSLAVGLRPAGQPGAAVPTWPRTTDPSTRRDVCRADLARDDNKSCRAVPDWTAGARHDYSWAAKSADANDVAHCGLWM